MITRLVRAECKGSSLLLSAGSGTAAAVGSWDPMTFGRTELALSLPSLNRENTRNRTGSLRNKSSDAYQQKLPGPRMADNTDISIIAEEAGKLFGWW